MKPRTLLVLLVLVLGLGAFIWFYERKLPSSEEREEQSRKVLALEKDDVRAVTLETTAGTVHLERVDPPAPPKAAPDDEEEKKKDEGEDGDPAEPLVESEWRMTKPFTARAELMAVDRLLDDLTALEKSRTLEDVAPADVGLDKPRATVRLATAEGEKVLKIGAAVPTGGALIVGLAGSPKAYVVGDSFFADLQKPPGDWRDRQMIKVQREDIQRITLAGPGGAGPVTLAQTEDRFRVTSPVTDSADREKVDSLITELSGLTAERFIDEPDLPAEMGLTPARAVVEVAVRNGQPVRIELGAPTGASGAGSEPPPPSPGAESPDAAGQMIYARVGVQVFEARTRLPETAALPPAQWLSPALTSFDIYQVGAVTVRDAQGEAVLERAGTDWKRGKETISYVPVSDLLFTVTGARADRLLTIQEARELGVVLDRPALTLVLRPDTGSAETLMLYPPLVQGVPARVSGRDVVLLLPAGKLEEIRKNLDEVRKAKPVQAAKAAEGKKEE